TRGEQFLVLEYVDGVTFDFLRETNAVPKLRHRVELLAQAAEGLAAVHEAGFLHHDVNPRNFLIDREKRVKLIDFGLAVPNTPEFRRPGNRTGTLNYMAPELIRRETIDERIDIFAFGVLAFEFLTGRLPYDAAGSMQAMIQRINAEPLDPGAVDPSLPPALQDLLRALTARSRDDRPRTMRKVAETLRALASRKR
ncbi:MAG: serine/threonine-protein kinase, partial [Isosphaeraceae bacterium]